MRRFCILAAFYLFTCSTAKEQPDITEVDNTSQLETNNETEQVIPFGPETRGYKIKRGIVHIHSAYSHDGCSSNGWDGKGAVDLQCIEELRLAPCQSAIDFVMQTDHPSHVKEVQFETALHFNKEKGDELAFDLKGRPFANRIKCEKGGDVWFYVGCEGKKNMPIAMSGPIPEEVFSTDYGDKSPLEDALKAVEKAREMGGFAFAVHTEEPNISAERIIALGLDGMEIYNLHANLMAKVSDFFSIAMIDKFMGKQLAFPDLALLTFLTPLDESLKKFDEVLDKIRISAVVATDIHRNVEIPALCEGGIDGNAFCENLSQDYPNFVEFLTKGGPLPLSDGDRIDSYARSMRWFSNRVYVKKDDPEEIREAVGKGRGYATFDVFGFPEGFDFFGITSSGKVVEMGEEVDQKEGITIYVRKPYLVSPPWGIPNVKDYSMAVLTTILIGPNGLKIQTESPELKIQQAEKGFYRVEVRIKPLHLKSCLQGIESLAEKEYPFIYSNAIRIK